MIHFLTQGEDYTYHIMKGWQKKVDDTTANKWIDAISKTYVCDTRQPESPCLLEGYNRVDDITLIPGNEK